MAGASTRLLGRVALPREKVYSDSTLRWCESGNVIFVLNMASGCTVAVWWLHSGCRVAARCPSPFGLGSGLSEFEGDTSFISTFSIVPSRMPCMAQGHGSLPVSRRSLDLSPATIYAAPLEHARPHGPSTCPLPPSMRHEIVPYPDKYPSSCPAPLEHARPHGLCFTAPAITYLIRGAVYKPYALRLWLDRG